MPPSGPLFVVAFVLAVGGTPLVARGGEWLRLRPRDERRGIVAHRPISRLGGLAMAVAFLGAAACAFLGRAAAPGLLADPLLWVAGAIAFAAGFIDDLRPLPALLKLVALFVAGLIVAATGLLVVRLPLLGWTLSGPLAVLVTALWVVALTTAWNFIDGLDGLAASLAVITATTYWIIGAGERLVQPLAPALSGVALGFLVHNRPPAKIFMGDGGSFLLGFWIAVLSLQAGPLGAMAASPLLLLVVAWPLADLVCAVVLRCKRRALLRASADHLHYLLLRRVGHRPAVLVAISIAGALAVVAASASAVPAAWPTALAALALWLVCARVRIGGFAVGAFILMVWLQQTMAFPARRERVSFSTASVAEPAWGAPHAPARAEARR